MMEYMQAFEMQKQLLEKRQSGGEEDTLLIVEHDPVITSGIRGNPENITVDEKTLKDAGISVYSTDRGGDVTYHGPGQIVGYPVIDLKKNSLGVKEYIYRLEEVFISLLEKEYGIKAEREEGKYTGVWVGNTKITAIGVAIRKWVTMHGFAFNVNTNMDHFRFINPCGLSDRGVTSLEILTGEKQDMEKLKKLTAKYFCETFGFRGEWHE